MKKIRISATFLGFVPALYLSWLVDLAGRLASGWLPVRPLAGKRLAAWWLAGWLVARLAAGSPDPWHTSDWLASWLAGVGVGSLNDAPSVAN